MTELKTHHKNLSSNTQKNFIIIKKKKKEKQRRWNKQEEGTDFSLPYKSIRKLFITEVLFLYFATPDFTLLALVHSLSYTNVYIFFSPWPLLLYVQKMNSLAIHPTSLSMWSINFLVFSLSCEDSHKFPTGLFCGFHSTCMLPKQSYPHFSEINAIIPTLQLGNSGSKITVSEIFCWCKQLTMGNISYFQGAVPCSLMTLSLYYSSPTVLSDKKYHATSITGNYNYNYIADNHNMLLVYHRY